MKIIDGRELYRVFSIHANFAPFTIYTYEVGDVYVDLLSSIPVSIAEKSRIYLNSERLDDAVVKRLKERGYRVYAVPGLHAKVIILRGSVIVGSANLTGRSLRNYEAVVVLSRSSPVEAQVSRVLAPAVRRARRL